jgi:hypothetical protein
MQSWQGPSPVAASAASTSEAAASEVASTAAQAAELASKHHGGVGIGRHGERPAASDQNARGWSISLPPQLDGSWRFFLGLTQPKTVYQIAHKCLDVSQSGKKN